MIHDARQFGLGIGLLVVFICGLGLLFSPLFEGDRNALDYLDGVFNSVSKASAYYIPKTRERSRKLEGTAASISVEAGSAGQAAELEKLFQTAGATVVAQGTKLQVSGDLGRVLGAALDDADAVFKNDVASAQARYGFDGRRALVAWHAGLGEAVKDLTRQGRFADSATVRDALTKGVEPAYNYYGVTPVPMRNMMGIALVALAGYVIYTVWYGFAILFLFEGWGLNLEH